VIPVGLWRRIGYDPPKGLRLVALPGGVRGVVFDNEGMGAEAVEARDRGRMRELTRLVYVTLTRARQALVIPWSETKVGAGSFADIWGLDPAQVEEIAPVPDAPPACVPPGAGEGEGDPLPPAEQAPSAAVPRPAFPRRILPHQLAAHPDAPRSALHESSIEAPLPVRDTFDPLEYGIWWHETLQFVPWDDTQAAVDAYGSAALARSEALGFRLRAEEEWGRLLSSGPWGLMREGRWSRLAEAGIFAPRSPVEWIDGVIDLVLHDPESAELWIVDWKTNRRMPGEDDRALLSRLAAVYERQLAAYGACVSPFFTGARVRLWVYSTVAGRWTETFPGP
jgi:ATP-dependent exoDNAse (exonuclease V) beta subunit